MRSDIQAEVVQRYVLARASGVEVAFWHNLHTNRDPDATPWSGSALLRRGSHTPAANTYHLLTSLLKGSGPPRAIASASDQHVYQFGAPGAPKYVVWGVGGMPQDLPDLGRAPHFVILDGQIRSLHASSDTASLGTLQPVFIISASRP